MYLRTVLILVVLGALVVFAVINWNVFMAPTTLSIIFATVEAPLGLILLGVIALLTLLFLVYVVYLQSSLLVESRRHARELQGQRELADQAEISRFSQLRSFLENELRNLTKSNEASRAGITARLDQLERELRIAVEQSGNTLAAYIGEIEDRLERAVSSESAR
jgi:ABC-type multidrug transport system fused ATPase/permease subunit